MCLCAGKEDFMFDFKMICDLCDLWSEYMRICPLSDNFRYTIERDEITTYMFTRHKDNIPNSYKETLFVFDRPLSADEIYDRIAKILINQPTSKGVKTI